VHNFLVDHTRPDRFVNFHALLTHARLLYIKMNLLALISRNFLVSLSFFQIRNIILNQTFALEDVNVCVRR